MLKQHTSPRKQLRADKDVALVAPIDGYRCALFFIRVAQMAEHLTFNQGVVSSILTAGTIERCWFDSNTVHLGAVRSTLGRMLLYGRVA